jgi:hypothetical protein
VVVQQPVGLIGAQVVLTGQDVVVPQTPRSRATICATVSASIVPSAPAGGVSTVVV